MKKIFYTFALVFVFMACKKTITQPRSGIFRGVFEMTGTNGGGFESGDCTIALNDVSNTFSLSVDTTASYPFACGGTYNMIDGVKMEFSRSGGVDTSEFDVRHMYLDTVYNYVFDDIYLIFYSKQLFG